MTDLFFCIIFAALLVKLINCHKSNFLTPIAEMLGLRPKAGLKMAVPLTMSQMTAWAQPGRALTRCTETYTQHFSGLS